MTESEEEQRPAEPSGDSPEPEPRMRKRKLLHGGLRGGVLGALISGLLAWGLVSGASGQGADWRAVLPTAAALLAMPFGFAIGAVIGTEAASRRLDR